MSARLVEALRAILARDNGDEPGLWPLAAELDEARAAMAEAQPATVKDSLTVGAQPVQEPRAWMGPVGQTMPHEIYVAWSERYPEDAKHFQPLYAAPPQPVPSDPAKDIGASIPWVLRPTGRTIPDLTGREHVCQWQRAIKPTGSAPAQPVPLTDRQLAQIWDDALNQLDPRDQMRFVARAIERAHGIQPPQGVGP